MYDQNSPAFDLGQDIEALRGSVRAFARSRIAPLAADIDRTDAFPRHLWREMGELGLHGVTVPPADGGVGMGYLAHAVAAEEIARASASVGLSYLAHSNLCINQLARNGDTSQKGRYLPGLLSGEAIGALAMSEANAGSDVMGMSLRARPVAGGWRLDGHKMWITNGPVADLVIVYARTGDEPSPRLTAFLVEAGTPGFSVSRSLDKLGHRGSPTGELVFDSCLVPEANVLGGVDQGARVLMSGLDYERIIASALPVGLMHACLDLVTPYLHQRRQFDQPIGSFQLMQGKLADMYTRLSACKALVYAVAGACDRVGHGARILRKDCAAALLATGENANWMASQAVQCLGGNGYVNDTPAGRLLRDAKLYEIGGGTSEIRRWLIGREIFEATA